MEEKLKKLIRENKVIPFVGAGVSKEVKFKNGDNAFINWKELLERFVSQIENKKSKAIIEAMLIEDDDDPIDYLEVANKIESTLLKNDFNNVLNNVFSIDYNDINETTYNLAKEIWNLNSNLIITTNYDNVLFNASNDKNKIFWDIESKYEQSNYLTNQSNSHIVWNLHGHINRVDNIILTSQKYKKLYSDNIQENKYKSSLHTLKTLISTQTLLFVGFSLDDKYVVQQLNDIFDIFDGNTHNHYILVKKGTRINSLTKNIKVIEYEDHGEPLIELIKSLQPTIQKVGNKSAEQEDTPNLKEIYNSNHLTTLPKRNKSFIGRVADLSKIKAIFEKDTITSIVNGIGGVGKSELSIEYFHINKDNYNNIAFIELSEDGSSLEDIFLSKFNKAKLSLDTNADFDTLIQALQNLPKKNLLLVDNLETKEEFEKIELLNSTFDILVTTRKTDFNIPKENKIDLETLNYEDAKKLYLSIYNDKNYIDEILEYLDYHPLFINLTTKSLKEEFISIDELREDIKNNNIYQIDSEDDKTFEEHLNDRFDRQFKNESNDELKELLKMLAIFPSIEIDFKILEKTITIEKLKVKLQKLVQRGWLNKKDDSYKLHQIIKTFIQTKYPISYKDITFIFDNIDSYIDTDDSTLIASQLSEYIPIIESFLNLYKDKEDNHICGILDSITFLYYSLGKYKKSLDYQEKSFNIRKDIFGKNSEYTAKSYNLLSRIFQAMRELAKALEYQTKAKEIQEDILGDKHPSLATSYNNISDIYRVNGELPKALEYQTKAIKIREEIAGDKHPDLATNYNNISLIYKAMGELAKALEYQSKALKIREEIPGDEHPDLAQSYNNISMIYKDLKECNKAKKFMEKAVYIWEQYDYYKKELFDAYEYIKIIEFNIKKEKKIKKIKDKGKFCKDA